MRIQGRKAALPLFVSLHLSLITSFLSSCTSDSYHINGFARDFQEGDTICLAEEGTTDKFIAQTTVANGKFLFEGETEVTQLCRIFAKREPDQGIDFFLEADDITIELSDKPGLSRVSGTRVNNEWQLLTDSIQLMGFQVTNALRMPDNDSLSHLRKMDAIDSLHRRMSACIEHTAQRNSDNDLGQYISKHYKAPEFK